MKEIINQMKPDRKSGFIEKLILQVEQPCRNSRNTFRPMAGTGVGGVPVKLFYRVAQINKNSCLS